MFPEVKEACRLVCPAKLHFHEVSPDRKCCICLICSGKGTRNAATFRGCNVVIISARSFLEASVVTSRACIRCQLVIIVSRSPISVLFPALLDEHDDMHRAKKRFML